MTRLIDEKDQIVTDAIDGMLASSQSGRIARLDGFPQIKVVVRTDTSVDRVAVISGGGAGHEPAHAGFVGYGMLTAAVAGEPFASPSIDAVLAAILAVTGSAGCLLIVKNYTGDRLNFGLAAERARELGFAVEMVIVKDDIALAEVPQPRGIAGTLFAHKVAGYYAENGASLVTVKARVEEVLSSTCSIGLALSSCNPLTQPFHTRNFEPELGLGIHGEPGAETIDINSALQAVKRITDPLEAALPANVPLAVLVNNLGSVTALEMDIVTRDLLNTDLGSRCELLIGPSPLMTALNMYGFSVSATVLTDEVRTALSAHVEPACWPQAVVPKLPKIVPLPTLDNGDDLVVPEADPATEKLLVRICDALIKAESILNELDAYVGDADTGSTVAAGARAVEAALTDPGLPLANKATLLRVLGRITVRNMGGSSGVLLSLLFTAASNAFAEGATLVDALRRGTQTMQHYSGARLGDRTFIDALLPALDTFAKTNNLNTAAHTARTLAHQTSEIHKTESGRSAYLRAESLAGHPDPGAVAVAIAFEAAVS